MLPKNDRVVSIAFEFNHGEPTIRTREVSVGRMTTALIQFGMAVTPMVADEAKIQETARELVALRLALLSEGQRLALYDKDTAATSEWISQVELYVSYYRTAQAVYLMRGYEACRTMCGHLASELAANRPLLPGEMPNGGNASAGVSDTAAAA